MINANEVTVKLNRIDICDLLLACLAAKDMTNDAGKKWDRLHDELKAQLKAYDAEVGID